MVDVVLSMCISVVYVCHPYSVHALVPEENMVNIQKGATVIKGEMKHSLLDGNIDYDVDKGFTRHMIDDAGDNGGGIVLKLGLQSILNHIRIL